MRSPALRLDRLKHNDGYDPVGLSFILSEAAVVALLLGPDAISLSTGGSPSPERTSFGSNLGGDLGMGDKVVVPIRMTWGSTPRREHRHGTTQILVHQRVDTFNTTARSFRVQEQQRRPFEVAANVAAVRAELINDVPVPRTDALAHTSSSRLIGASPAENAALENPESENLADLEVHAVAEDGGKDGDYRDGGQRHPMLVGENSAAQDGGLAR